MGGTVPPASPGIVARVTIDSAPFPVTLRWAVRLLWAEAAALGLIAMWLIWADLTATTTDLLSALLVTVFAIGARWCSGRSARPAAPPARRPGPRDRAAAHAAADRVLS